MEDFQAHETHVSRLVFTPERVYKVKRPVRFGFLDFSTVEARRRACHDEVELNRRLAPDVYEGVGEFTDPDGRSEPVVVMRRLPDSRRLSVLVRRDHPALVSILTEVAATLAGFHRRAQRGADIDRDCGSEAQSQLWMGNLDELRALGAGIVDIESVDTAWEAAAMYIAGRGLLFDERIARGAAVDGHGDLMCDDTFALDDGPRLLDCLEFDPRLRHVDALLDAASLAMDLEHLGRPDLAATFLRSYRDISADRWPESLAHLYIAYRAAVRAKVAVILAGEGDRWNRAQVDKARSLLGQAVAHLKTGTVRLVLVGGLPGTGKTTLAHRLSMATGWPVLSSDVVRKRLAGLDPEADASAAFGAGIYSDVMTATVYEELLGEAEVNLTMGQSVIIDASWIRQCWRDAAREVAERCLAEFLPIRCRVPGDVARARISRRARAGAQPSDATPSIHDEMASALEPWIDAITVDTSTGVEEPLQVALEVIGAGPGLGLGLSSQA